MDQNLTPLERAFQVARSGKANATSDIRKVLKGLKAIPRTALTVHTFLSSCGFS